MDDKPESSEPERPAVLHDEQAQRQKLEKQIEQSGPEKEKGAPAKDAPF
jgi:hypothetical protein